MYGALVKSRAREKAVPCPTAAPAPSLTFVPPPPPRNTTRPQSTDRIMASSVTCTWRYTTQPPCYDAAFNAAKASLLDAFFGPAKGGVYSPSVQYTLYDMAQILLDRVPQVCGALSEGGRHFECTPGRQPHHSPALARQCKQRPGACVCAATGKRGALW